MKIFDIFVNAHLTDAKTFIRIADCADHVLLVVEDDIRHDKTDNNIGKGKVLKGGQFHNAVNKCVDHFIIVNNTTEAATEKVAHSRLRSFWRNDETDTNDRYGKFDNAKHHDCNNEGIESIHIFRIALLAHLTMIDETD